MSKPTRGFQINTILDRLALDMLGILHECLTRSPVDRDRLHLAVLLTLSRRIYVENLLFRDYRLDRESQWYSLDLPDGSKARVHEQGIVYLHKVLMRRPRLARRLRHEPGNMHLLLGLFCRHGPRQYGWHVVEIRRDEGLAASGEAPDFVDHVVRELAAQRERLGDDFGEESRRRRAEYGPIWLIRGDCVVEVPEEISLFEVIDATPVPLQAAFAEDHEVQRMLARVLDSLNERYMLLRASGLDPEEWHDRDEPSIARLREMKQLRKPAEEMLRLGVEDDNARAYRRAFDELKGSGKQFVGCASFDEFAGTEHGMAVLRYSALSLDEPIGSDDEGEEWALGEAIADPDADVSEDVIRRRQAGQWVEMLVDEHPEWFGDLMRYFFAEVIGRGRPIHGGPGQPGLLEDAAFRQLVEADPALCVMDDAELAQELWQRAEAIIQQGIRQHAYPEQYG